MKSLIKNINKIFDHRVRLGIMAALIVNEYVDFNTFKELLDVTDGNLASHLKTLEKEDYIIIKKEFINKKPNTKYYVTKLGEKEFKKHIDALEKLINKQK